MPKRTEQLLKSRMLAHGNTGQPALRRKALSLAVAAALAIPTAAVAQEEPVALEEIVVSSFRESLMDAMDIKKSSGSIVEAVAAEEIGKLPDVSIAESIARLPGLTAQRLNGRGQVFVDYVRIPETANKDYTLHYLQDVRDDVEHDWDTPTLPETLHGHLVDYVVARCLLPKARGKRIQREVEGLNAFAGRVEQARYHNRNVALDNAVTSGGW